MIGVPMGFLDFAPEPPAPTATPVSVTEHIDLNCTPSHDTRDLSSKCDLAKHRLRPVYGQYMVVAKTKMLN